MITFQQLVIYSESNRDSFAPFTLRGRLRHTELSRAPISVIWLLHLVDTAEACVSCATVLGYSRLLPARCWNMPHVTRNPWQQFRLSLRIEWLPRICGHPYHPTWPLLISFYRDYVKEHVFHNKPHTTDALRENITNGIKQTDSIILQCRIQMCLVEDGGYCQHMMCCKFLQHAIRYVSYQYYHILFICW
jgi:hypothetical protein